ncbi:MAG: hypothetical protein K2W96_27240 [Gemmataceae bacterium]|nr:hypothetical protein [Gemmataceae bacterium]
MTDWNTSADPEAMLAALGGHALGRKLRLFLCAALRATTTYQRLHRAIGVAEAFADAGPDAPDGAVLEKLLADLRGGPISLAIRELLGPVFDLGSVGRILQGLAADARGRADLLREVMGDPFDPVLLRTGWMIANHCQVSKLARALHASRRWEELPLLADALLDAGCDDERLLGHLRSGGPHVRGCWALDLLADAW